jgi:hypothetical protein
MGKKRRTLRDVAKERRQAIREIILQEWANHGSQSGMAKALDVQQPNVSYWMKKLNIEVKVKYSIEDKRT